VTVAPPVDNGAMPRGLLGLTTALVAIPSVSHVEGPMADAVEAALRLCPWLEVERVGDNVVARTDLGRSYRVLMAGHLDTVPPTSGNEEPRIVDGTLYGVGSADMKGGLAVFLHLAGTVPEPGVDVTWCFYAGEEVAQEFNGLRHLWEHRPDLLAADAAILGEPTDGVVEAGCQGTLRVRISLAGRRAHTARPHTGRNAIHRLAPLLAAVASYESRRPVLDGCEYVEQVQAVEVAGGVAGNVVPDEVSVLINHRFAPDRTADEAEASLRALLGPHLEPGDRWELVDAAAGAPPSLDHPVLADLVSASRSAPLAKQGWTDAASLWAHGIPAANFGPGDPLLAHRPDEHVTTAQLERAASVLDTLLRTEH
jgi:succinyl-diaminopimelate desuccinylase